ncbi:MAG: hypothetical protein WCG29_06995 [Desulfomonile sp.]|jgi:hypothetical protein|nr:hypothetical protein [Deltaproteobacteria bacterium]
MRAIFSVMLMLSLLMSTQSLAQSVGKSVESGVIQEFSEDKVYILGETGLHVLELLGVCAWCEEGESVAVFFDSLTRASIRPDPNPLRKNSVQTLIIRDGREDVF